MRIAPRWCIHGTITGQNRGGAIRKLNASYAITNASAEDIRRYSPNSTADRIAGPIHAAIPH